MPRSDPFSQNMRVSSRSAGLGFKNECAATADFENGSLCKSRRARKTNKRKRSGRRMGRRRVKKRVSNQQNDAGASRFRLVRDTDPRVGWRKESGQWTGDFVIATACRIYVKRPKLVVPHRR